jgi:hypothetical protein
MVVKNWKLSIVVSMVMIWMPWFLEGACLTTEQMTFLGFTKAEEAVTSDKEICKGFLTGKKACVNPGDLQGFIETKLVEMRDMVKKQMELTINNFWNITGRWNRLYSKIVEYKATTKWTVKHVIINNNMSLRADFTNLRYNKVHSTHVLI